MTESSEDTWRGRRIADGGLGRLRGSTRSRFFDPMPPSPIFETRVAGKGGQFAKGGGRVPGQGKPGGAKSLSPSDLHDFEGPAGASTWQYLESDGAGGTRFNAERTALHEKIIEDALAGLPRSVDPTFTMLGGGPGAGKSTTSESVGVPNKTRAAWADPDHFKQQLPEYDPKNPSPVHEESSYLAREMTRRALERGHDVVIDGVGDNPVSVGKKAAAARAAGYKVRAVYSTTETETASVRNQARARSVEDSMLRAKHAEVSRNFEAISDHFDTVELWHNTGTQANPSTAAPVRLAHKAAGDAGLTIDDAAGYAAFKAKANA